MTALVRASILIIDDDPLMRGILQQMLRNFGHLNAVAVESGATALAHLQTSSEITSAIFLDLKMPDMDGVEFIRQLAQRKYRGGIALISGVDERYSNRSPS